MTDENLKPWGIDLQKLAQIPEEVDPPPSEEDQVKEALRKKQHEDKFGGDDAADHLSDEEIWEQTKTLFHRRIND